MIIIDPSKNKLSLNILELFQYKDLFLTMASRDFKVRYAQTFLGFLWAFIQPVITITILYLVFGIAVKVDTKGVPYILFAMSGLISWNYFSFVLSQSGASVISAQNLIKKIYFPRLIIPLSKAIVGLIDFLIVFGIYIILMVYYGIYPQSDIFVLPVFIVLAIICALACGIWLSALTVRFRDFQQVIPFVIQIGLYVSPVAYSSSSLPAKLIPFYYLNPMAGVIDGFRWCLLGNQSINSWSYLSFGLIVVIFVSGLFYFRKVERVMADII